MTNSSIRPIITALIPLLLLPVPAPGSVAAQTITLTAGQTVAGRLDSNDPTLSDDTHYDLYLYKGRPGDEITVTLRSSDFDAYLAGGVLVGSDLVVEEWDDDGAGGTDARLNVTVGDDGIYGLRANSLFERETGAYTLTVERVSGRASGPEGVVSMGAGQTISGRLEPGDAVLGDGSYYDLYLYEGRPGDEILVTLRSNDFDAYLVGGVLDGSTLIVEDSDDDGAGGTDAGLAVTVGEDGTYAFRANSLFEKETGAYTLTVERVDRRGASAVGVVTIAAGQTISGQLGAGDAVLNDGSYYDLYLYQGSPGDEIVVTLRSSAFDAYLAGGELIGSELIVGDSNDDGAGGTDARLRVTVGEAGTYGIRANSLFEDEIGAYTLTVERSDVSRSPRSDDTGAAPVGGPRSAERDGDRSIAKRFLPGT